VFGRHEESASVTNEQFYERLFAPLSKLVGPIDKDTVVALIGFDAGGPLNFCTIGRHAGHPFPIYVSCELAVRPDQVPSESGRYELLVSCDDESWVRSILTRIGRMSLEAAFGAGHTLDIGPWVDPVDRIQGVAFEELYSTQVSAEGYCVLRCLGLTRSELDLAQDRGSESVISGMRARGVYPHITTRGERACGRTSA
jgi:Suppressor of fused protein (SUFU)